MEGQVGEKKIFRWNGDEYDIEDIESHRMSEGEVVVDFPSSDNAHVVTVSDDQARSCSCPDYEYRRSKEGKKCKHMVYTEQEVLTDGGEQSDEITDYNTMNPREVQLSISDPSVLSDISEVLEQKRNSLDEQRQKKEDEVEKLLDQLETAEQELDELDQKVESYDEALQQVEGNSG